MWCDIVLKLYLVEHASPRETLLRGGGCGPSVTNATKRRHVFNLPYRRSNIVVCIICPKLMHIYLNCNIDVKVGEVSSVGAGRCAYRICFQPSVRR